MKKILFLLPSLFLLNGCAESVALLGSSVGGASNGKMLQSSLNSVISYGVKKQTGKSPLEHAFAYAEDKNPEKKKETCISIDRTRSEFCTILNKQISSTNSAVKEKTLEIVKKYPKNNKTSENTVLEEENFMSSFLLKTSPRKLAIAVQAKMKEKSKNKDLN